MQNQGHSFVVGFCCFLVVVLFCSVFLNTTHLLSQVIHSFNSYVLNDSFIMYVCSPERTALGAGDIAENKTDKNPCHHGTDIVACP